MPIGPPNKEAAIAQYFNDLDSIIVKKVKQDWADGNKWQHVIRLDLHEVPQNLRKQVINKISQDYRKLDWQVDIKEDGEDKALTVVTKGADGKYLMTLSVKE